MVTSSPAPSSLTRLTRARAHWSNQVMHSTTTVWASPTTTSPRRSHWRARLPSTKAQLIRSSAATSTAMIPTRASRLVRRLSILLIWLRVKRFLSRAATRNTLSWQWTASTKSRPRTSSTQSTSRRTAKSTRALARSTRTASITTTRSRRSPTINRRIISPWAAACSWLRLQLRVRLGTTTHSMPQSPLPKEKTTAPLRPSRSRAWTPSTPRPW